MKFKPDWEATQKRLEALWEREIVDRCTMAIVVCDDEKGYSVNGRIPPGLPECEIRRYYMDGAFITERARRKFEGAYFAGEALPCVFPYFGTAAFVQYYGAKPQYKHDTVWFNKFLDEPDASLLNFQKNDAAFAEQLNLVRSLVGAAGGDYFVSMTDNCGIIDGLAQIRGNENLLIDMLENPRFVKKATAKLIEMQTYTTAAFFDAIKSNNLGGSTHSWMHAWCPRRLVQLQCDFSVMISPEMFKEFVLPELEAAACWTDFAIYHLDGPEQVRHLDLILSVGVIKMIQWTNVAGHLPTSDYIPVLQRIQKAGKGLVLYLEPWEVEKVLGSLSAKGLLIIVRNIKSRAEADEMLEKTRKWTRE